MKQVFIETNFLVDLLRPFPKRDAAALFARVGVDVTLHIPWVSITEAKRTITSKIVDEDLGFADLVSKFGVKLLKSGTFSSSDMAPIQSFEKQIKKVRAETLKSVDANVDAAVAKMTVIPPSSGVVAKTVALYPIKSLPPFDEMVLGAVLYAAGQLKSQGVSDLYFCNANSKDFGPTSGNLLDAAYAYCSLKYRDNFSVPSGS